MANGRSKYWLTTPRPRTIAKDGDYQPYAERNALLRSMLNQSYEQYLESRLWDQVRAKVLARDNHRCLVCLGIGRQVHHTHYSRQNLLGDSLAGLITICGDCHYAIEHDEQHRKLPPSEVADRLTERFAAQARLRANDKQQAKAKARKSKKQLKRERQQRKTNPNKDKQRNRVICQCSGCGVSVVLSRAEAYASIKTPCHHATCAGFMHPMPPRSSAANTPRTR